MQTPSSPHTLVPLPPPSRANSHPIVLVGGFTVWGRDEGLGLKYWGGPGRDIQADLVSKGHETVTAAPGPLSSNWDRACELFAQLKGGRVDYGAAHAARCGHARFGRDYPGLLPGWGEKDEAGRIRKVHLVGHSQGGQTIRVLLQLLAEGSAEERAATAEAHPLFQGGHDWVRSLTTLATPHDGTTLVWKREKLLKPVQQFLAVAAQLSRPGSRLYDVKLDHWKLAPGEDSLKAVLSRLERLPLSQTHDFAPYDLSLDGAADLNAWVRLRPSVAHFSWSTAKTRPDGKGHQVPASRLTPLWRPGALYLGRTLSHPGRAPLDPSWLRNDGVVNTASMASPSTDPCVPFDGTTRDGCWNHMGVLDGWDHSDIIGFGAEHRGEVLSFYRHWASFLAALPDP